MERSIEEICQKTCGDETLVDEDVLHANCTNFNRDFHESSINLSRYISSKPHRATSDQMPSTDQFIANVNGKLLC